MVFYAIQYLFISRHPIIKRDKLVYCTTLQIRAVCDTDITDAEITELIEESDWVIDQEITSGSLSAIGYRKLSRLMTAYTCMLKDPNAISLGEYSEDRATTLKMMKDELDGIIMSVSGGIAFKYGYADLRWK